MDRPFSPFFSSRTVVLMFAGSTCIGVAVAVAESCEADEVGVGAVIVTVGVELASSAASSGLVSTPVVPPLPSSVPGSISTVTPVACGSTGPGFASHTRHLRVGICVSGVLVPELPPVCVSPDCPLTYEADGLVSGSFGDWPSGEGVVAVEPSPSAPDSLPVVPSGGEFATGIVSPEVESACEAAGAALPGVVFASAAAPPGARAVGAEPEPDPDPPAEPAPAAAAAPFPCTTAPLSPGFPTLTRRLRSSACPGSRWPTHSRFRRDPSSLGDRRFRAHWPGWRGSSSGRLCCRSGSCRCCPCSAHLQRWLQVVRRPASASRPGQPRCRWHFRCRCHLRCRCPAPRPGCVRSARVGLR